jgi:hypothetical protein
MKILLSIIAIFLFLSSSNAQMQTISQDEYEKVIQFAVSETNADYPVIFKVITNIIENGKTVRSETVVVEKESVSHHKSKRTILKDGKETNKYQITAGFGNVFCSDDGVKWTPSQYECPKDVLLYGPREAESTEYSVTTKSIKGKQIKIYRRYLVFAPFTEGKKKTFRERVSTIDSRGFFITVEDTEGTLDPKTVTLTRKQSWITKAKINPIVAPTKLATNE